MSPCTSEDELPAAGPEEATILLVPLLRHRDNARKFAKCGRLFAEVSTVCDAAPLPRYRRCPGSVRRSCRSPKPWLPVTSSEARRSVLRTTSSKRLVFTKQLTRFPAPLGLINCRMCGLISIRRCPKTIERVFAGLALTNS